MTLTELMLGNMQAGKSAAMMQLGAHANTRGAAGNEKASFSGILGSKLSNTANRNQPDDIRSGNSGAGEKKTDPAVQNDNRQKYLTYREASAKNVQKASDHTSVKCESKAEQTGKGQTDKVGDEEKDSRKEDSTPNNLLQAFAQVLGMNAGELQKLLKQAGITPESFNNLQNLSENVNKLSQLLGLNSEQEGTLIKLLQLTEEALGAGETEPVQTVLTDTAAEGAKTATAETVSTKPADAKAASAATVTVQQTLQETDVSSMDDTLNDAIKLKLDEFSQKFATAPDKAVEEVKQLMESMNQTSQVQVQAVSKSEDVNQNDTVTQQNSADPKTTAANASEASSSKSDNDAKEAGTGAKKEAAVQQQADVPVEKQFQPVFTVVQPDQAGQTSAAEAVSKTELKTPATAKEIMNQVIEKAKVILTPDKSEMVIDLKPDSLGKISLKVTTENGLVMAKFVADSQQVRQVLETNMQLLKDSLERQGMNVQGFSVSVRQDSNRPNQNWNWTKSGKSFGSRGAANQTSGIEGSLTGMAEAAIRSNPYNWGGSTINLTA